MKIYSVVNDGFDCYTDDELAIIARIDRELSNEIFSLHRQGYDMREVLGEARWFKAEADEIKRELQMRRKSR